MAVRVQTGDIEPLQVYVVDVNGNPLTGLTDLYVRLRRSSNGDFLDWADDTFKAVGWTALDVSLAEISATLAPGLYELSGGIDTGAWVNPSADDDYLVLAVQSPGTNAKLPPPAELKVGQWVDNLDEAVSTRIALDDDVTGFISGEDTVAEVLNLLRQMVTNRIEEQSGTPGTIRLYYDDGVNVRFIWQIRPETGDTIGEILGSPARRSAASP